MFSGYRALAERLREIVLAEEISPKEIGAPLTVLLTSTQSEWGRMTTESEIEAYLSLVAQNSMPGPLIIKPHPRENQAKISDLVSRLRGLGWEVLNLANNELLAMMPVESQLLTLEAEFGVTVLTTSSAAYGVALICGVKPVIGFGSDLVKKYFKPEYQTMRLEHEKLLISYSNKFLSLHQNWSMCDSNKNCSQGEIMPIDYTHSQNLHTITGPLAAIPKLFHNTRPLSVLDVGCGTGTWLKAFIDLGTADVVGVDAVEIPEDQLLIPIDRFHLINLERPWDLERKFDVVLCLEVAEHLDEADASQFILSLTIHADIIFFSAACPNQLGQHHVNCQWPAYWQALFNLYGYSCLDEIRWSLWDDVRIEPWYRQNMFVAQRNLQTSGKEPRIKPVIHPDMIQYLTRL
jgi:SAM-dependent methyltransferase